MLTSAYRQLIVISDFELITKQIQYGDKKKKRMNKKIMILVIKAFGVYLDMGSRPSSLIKRHRC